MNSYALTLHGSPRTKKTSNRLFNGRVHPSLAFEAWNNLVQPQLAIFRAKSLAPAGTFPIKCQVNCRALFYRHADVGDATGFYQALADALQEGGIVGNDRQIRSWDGSMLLKDRDNPRIIVTLEEIA